MATGITDKPEAVRRAMANLPPKQKDSMRNTVTACYDQLATIEMQLREERTNATSVRCRGQVHECVLIYVSKNLAI